LLPHERQLLTDQQLKDASVDQIEDLVQRINLMMQRRGMPGLVWRTRDDQTTPSAPSNPGTIGSQ
jgi:thymidylate synthase